MKEPCFYCIDMKSFYASVECAERGLNPLETKLVVADTSRGKNALCLAVSPKLRALGVKNRCRLSDIPSGIEYITALPRMQFYIEYAADIYAIYLDYFSPADIHVYSIDECFIDATRYLDVYRETPESLAKKLMNEIAARLHIPSTAGIGSNLYLAKIALDITAKHTKDHIGRLTEQSYRETLWDHRPITDFWQIAKGTAARLEHCGIRSMREIAQADPELLYKLFGVNAELLIDHAWGRESCRIEDIKNARPKSRSVSFSQILPRDYRYDEARIVMAEMILHGCQELMRREVITRKLWLGIGYTRDVLPFAKGSVRLTGATALPSLIRPSALALFDRLADRSVKIRRLAVSFEDVCDEDCEGYDLFSDRHSLEREKARERAVLALSERFGKNAVLRGFNLLDSATQRERNEMIGGHRAGYDDERGSGEAISAL